MKRKKVVKNKKGVNVIVGIILMVAITVMIAVATYYYVPNHGPVFEEPETSPIRMEIYSKEVMGSQLYLKINFISDVETSQDQYGIVVEYQEEKPTADHMGKEFARVSKDSYDDHLCDTLYPGNNVKEFTPSWYIPNSMGIPNSTGFVKEYKVVIYLLRNGEGAYQTRDFDTIFVYYPGRAIQTEGFSIFM